jgi:superfamily II DNA/RNA helicase
LEILFKIEKKTKGIIFVSSIDIIKKILPLFQLKFKINESQYGVIYGDETEKEMKETTMKFNDKNSSVIFLMNSFFVGLPV